MEIYVWDTVSPTRDGALDAEVIFHELTHGLSGRLIGDGYGLADTQCRGLGEGWSDFMALSLLSEPGDDPNACYAYGAYTAAQTGWSNNYYYGSRRFPYSTDTNKAPQTLADIDPEQMAFPPEIPTNPTLTKLAADEPHRIGEIWCLALWECRRNLIERYGFAGNQMMMLLVVDGMKLTPSLPTFVQARDAILQADLVSNCGSNRLALWQGFAKRGLGYGTSVPAATGTLGVKESFDLPIMVSTMAEEGPGADGDGYVEPGENGQLKVVLTSYEIDLHSITGMLAAVSSNVAVTQGFSAFADISAGEACTSATPFGLSVSPAFPGFTDASFLLAVSTEEDSFYMQLATRIGNPYDYPPEIADIIAQDISCTNAIISWTTGIPADSQVLYGVTTNYGLASPLDPVMGTNHTVALFNLQMGSTYHYCVVSRGTNGLASASSDRTFNTRTRFYVSVNSSATQELGTIEAPFKSLQAAVDSANAGDEAVVAEGTYTSTSTDGVVVLDGAAKNFSIRGGYDAAFSECNPGIHATAIDGESERIGVNVDNGATLRLRGLVVTNCAESYWGGGIRVRGSRLEAENCLIRGCVATFASEYGLGGGLYATLGSDVRLRGCRIEGNVAEEIGGGIYTISSTTFLEAINCRIADNLANSGGGVAVRGVAVLVNCVVENNMASNRNPVYLFQSSGGGISCGGSLTLTNCTIVHNAAMGTVWWGGGGVYVYPGLGIIAKVVSSIVVSNTGLYGADVHTAGDYTEAEVSLYNSDIGDIYGRVASSSNLISADPKFRNLAGGDFHLMSNSPCIDAGAFITDSICDMDGEARPYGPAIDMGADEYVDSDQDGLPDEWEVANSLDPHTDDATQDADLDGMNNLSEYLAGTNPRDSESLLGIAGLTLDSGKPLITWRTVFGKSYWLQRAMNLSIGDWTNVWLLPLYETNETPEGKESFLDLSVSTNSPLFYRILLE
jgi:hypothetical protein